MARVYLETSFVSACVTERADAGSVHRRATSLEWWASQSMRHQLHVSDEVIAELSHPDYPRSRAALDFVSGIPMLQVSEEVTGLAGVFIQQKVVPGPLAGDAIHLAAACLYGMEYVLSWNVRHLANPNKAQHLARICMRLNLIPPRIVTPDLLWETDDEPR
jgi:hypothetical protein